MSDHTISLAFSVESPRPERKGLRRFFRISDEF